MFQFLISIPVKILEGVRFYDAKKYYSLEQMFYAYNVQSIKNYNCNSKFNPFPGVDVYIHFY